MRWVHISEILVSIGLESLKLGDYAQFTKPLEIRRVDDLCISIKVMVIALSVSVTGYCLL